MVNIDEVLSGCQIVFANTNSSGFLTELIVADTDGTQYFLRPDICWSGTCIAVENEECKRVI
jgi:hypothetical protein